jgi:hypothetical protein
MKKYRIIFFLLFLFLLGAFFDTTYAQSRPIMYFCEKYSDKYGEIGISNKFTVGALTMVIGSEVPLPASKLQVQYDKYNPSSSSFDYYSKNNIKNVNAKKYFDIAFNEPGIYRVFLLSSANKTIASALIEIIR